MNMDRANDWPYMWFGFWREHGPAYASCPSVQEFVCPSVNSSYEKRTLGEYLKRAPIIAVTSKLAFPNPFTGAKSSGEIAARTDGRWMWLDDLPEYINENSLILPKRFLEDIEARRYKPPHLSAETIAKLKWESLPGSK